MRILLLSSVSNLLDLGTLTSSLPTHHITYTYTYTNKTITFHCTVCIYTLPVRTRRKFSTVTCEPNRAFSKHRNTVSTAVIPRSPYNQPRYRLHTHWCVGLRCWRQLLERERERGSERVIWVTLGYWQNSGTHNDDKWNGAKETD